MRFEKVLKFGGSSLATKESIDQVVHIIQQAQQETQGRIAVVFSAFGKDKDGDPNAKKLTDRLIEVAETAFSGGDYHPLYHEIGKEMEQRINQLLGETRGTELWANLEKSGSQLAQELGDFLESCWNIHRAMPEVFQNTAFRNQALDRIVSYGEIMTNAILTYYLSTKGMTAGMIDPREAIVTSSDHGNAKILDRSYDNIRQVVEKDIGAENLVILPGFVGATEDQKVTTLGRNGSDLSATWLATALNADCVEIWSDVDGLMSGDPRKIPNAKVLTHASTDELAELAHWETKVMHPRSIRPAASAGIPVILKNTFNPSAPGTLISNDAPESSEPVKAISFIEHVSLMSISGPDFIGGVGTLNRLTECLSKANINVMMVSQGSSEHTITVAINPKESQKANRAIRQEFKLELRNGDMNMPMVHKDCSVIAVVGDNMKNRPGVASRFLKALSNVNISLKIIAQGGEERNISVAFENGDPEKLEAALNAVHREFFEPHRTLRSLYIIGATGQIGQKLIELIDERRDRIAQQTGIELVVVRKRNSRETWSDGERTTESLQDFVAAVKAAHQPGRTVIDCTASEEVARHYEWLLNDGVDVVTPNKVANTMSQEYYDALREASREAGSRYRYETTVGAALPIIAAIRAINERGDRIAKIEAVASGTMSYLFNGFDGTKPFSQFVREARDAGYTEPHPRDDLNGMDVARKLLTMLRESGHQLELEDIEITGVLPEGVEASDDPETFLDQLRDHLDEVIAEKFQAAQERGKVLRYVASHEMSHARVALQELDKSHPFAGLTGTNNAFLFTCEGRESPEPAIIGPGAGVEWTAKGVLTDLIKVAKSRR